MKKMFLLVALASLLLLSTIEVIASQLSIPDYQYSSQVNSSLPGGISVRFKNGIDGEQIKGAAETWTSYPLSDASVSANFYQAHNTFGTTGYCYKTQGGAGAVEVYADTLDPDLKYYFQAVSTHYASYGGVTLYYPNMTTDTRRHEQIVFERGESC